MPAIMSELASIKSFFDSHHVPLSREWLESCVNWVKEENSGSNLLVSELQYKVYEQWLLLDLRDVELPTLPPNLSTHKKFVLTGSYSVQILQIVDISKPKLWQLDKIRNSNALKNNVELDKNEGDTGKRVLLITFTDGAQEVDGMEYRPIQKLNLNSRPGLKVRLVGPITVRRGRLMLEEQNVTVLGGEVEEIVVSNAAENVLARALNLAENPNPFVIDESMLTANKDMFTQGTQNFINNTVNTTRNVLNTNNTVKTTPKINKPQPMEQDFEEMRINAEIEMLMEAENDIFNTNVTVNPRHNTATPDLFDDDFEEINEEELIKKAETAKKTLQLSQNTSQSIKETITNNFEDLNELCDDVFGDFNLNVHLDKILTIRELQDLLTDKKYGDYKIKAKFHSIVQKLTVVEEQLYLVIKIQDLSAQIDVRLHSDIIAGFAGYTAAEFMGLKSNVINKDENATHKVIQALKDIREQLIKLDGNFEVKLEPNEKTPQIIKIL